MSDFAALHFHWNPLFDPIT